MHARSTIALAFLFTLALAPGPAHAAPKPTVAVLYFDYQGKNEELALLKKGLAQMLISDLSASDAYVVVERDRLEDVLAELKLGQSKAVDQSTASKIGKLLGARFMIMGGYFDVMGALRVDARVVEVETGKIIRSVGSNGGPEEFLDIENKLSKELGAILTGTLPASSKDPAKDPAQPTQPAKPAKPAKLKMGTALKYSKALDAKDRKDKEAAKSAIKDVLKEQPDFKLAESDLLALVQ